LISISEHVPQLEKPLLVTCLAGECYAPNSAARILNTEQRYLPGRGDEGMGSTWGRFPMAWRGTGFVRGLRLQSPLGTGGSPVLIQLLQALASSCRA
jgi:hypothetical protein